MSIASKDLIELAATASEESDQLDFKQEYSPEKKAAFWAETVKDIVSFANTRGGILVFGVLDDGRASGIDCTGLLTLDTAALSDQVRKYTSSDVPGLSIVTVDRAGCTHPAILVEPVEVPLVFTKVGTYEIAAGKQKTAFSLGTIYFRHGSKSEPCTRDDITGFIERRLKVIRNEWLGNIRKVVEAEPGSSVIVTSGDSAKVRISSDPSAPLVRLEHLSDSHPHRQSEVIRSVNEKLGSPGLINTHDIQAIKYHERINEHSHPNYVHKPHKSAPPQYSEEFVQMIIKEYDANHGYFVECRKSWRNKKT